MNDIHLVRRLYGESSKALKPYKRDEKDDSKKLLALGFVICESHSRSMLVSIVRKLLVYYISFKLGP